MVAIITYAVVIGIILCIVPLTQSLGLILLSIAGILFVATLILLFLGQVFLFLLPFILIAAVIIVIYLIVQKSKKI